MIWQALKDILNKARSWEELKSYLHNQNIEISFKCKGTTQEIQGIIFSRGKYSFKGSSIDSGFSYAKIDHQIKINNSPVQKVTAKQELSSAQPKSQNDILLSNLTNYLNSLGVRTLNTNKLLHWNDEDKDEDDREEEDVEKLLNNRRGIRL